MVGISSHPILLFNETASGFDPGENWPEHDGGDDDEKYESVEQVKQDTTGQFLPKRASSSKAPAPMNASEPLASPGAGRKKKENWADFTYTVSMAYAWGRGAGLGNGQARHGRGGGGGGGGEVEDMHVGYLDDEVIFGIGVDDVGQGFARVEMRELVGCMRACPGMDQASR